MPITKAKPKPAAATTATVKATAPKVAGTAPAKGAAATPAATNAPPAPKFKAGDTAIFVKYGDNDQPGIFTAGEEVFVHSSQLVDHPGLKNRKITAFICTKLEDKETAEKLTFDQLVADDGPVNAEEVGASKLKIKPPPKPEELPYQPKAVGALVEYVKAGDLTGRLRGLFEQEKRTEFEIGGLLAHVKFGDGNSEIAALGYEDTTDEAGKVTTAWEHYLDSEFNITYRTGNAFIQIYRAFSEIPNFAPAMISDPKTGIGWSKAALIAGYLPAQYDAEGESQKVADELVELARNTGIRELRTEVVTKFSTDGKTTAGTRTGARTGGKGATTKTWTFKLVDASATSVAQILELGGKQLGMPADSPKLFETIVNQWATDHLSPANQNRLKGKAAPAANVSKNAPRPAPVKAAPAAAANASA